MIGGGVGAITTVYAMTRDPSWRERYEITVYQLGWRLGERIRRSAIAESWLGRTY